MDSELRTRLDGIESAASAARDSAMRVAGRVDELGREVRTGLDRVESRCGRVEARLEGVDDRLGAFEGTAASAGRSAASAHARRRVAPTAAGVSVLVGGALAWLEQHVDLGALAAWLGRLLSG